MNNSTDQFLKRISFFLIYLPALVYGCQFAYFSGLSEPLGISLPSLGMNYFEVMFSGYLNLSIGLLENITKIAWFIIYLNGFIVVACVLHYFAVHPCERLNEMQRIKAHIASLEFNWPIYKLSIKHFLNSLLGIFFLYFSVFILSLLLIMGFYSKGKKEIEESIYKIKATQQCNYKTGYVTLENFKYRTLPIICGNYKCSGINLDKLEVIIYIPENYTQYIHMSKKIL